MLVKFIPGKHTTLPGVREFRCREITFRCPGMVLDVDGELIPTGRILPAEGDFDFSSLRRIAGNYDDCFVIDGAPACTVKTQEVTLKVFSDYPALQFYTGAFLDCGIPANAGFAVEPEFFPDTPNRPEFPNALLKAGENFSRYIEFVFE